MAPPHSLPLHRVRTVTAPSSARAEGRAALLISRALGVTVREAKLLLSRPQVLPKDLPEAEAQGLAWALRALEIEAQTVLQREGSEHSCTTHPTLSPHARCELCQRSVCILCMMDHGAVRCGDCQHLAQRRRRFMLMRVFLLLLALDVVGGRAWWLQAQREARRQWTRPLEVDVVLVAESDIPEASAAAWREGLVELEHWFTAEFRRHTTQDLVPFRFELRGLAPHVPAPPFQPTTQDWWGRLRHSWRLKRSLADIDARSGPSTRPEDLRIYVVLRDNKGQDPGFVDGIAETGGSVGMVRAPLRERDLGLPLTAVAHELLHCVGAMDKYTPQGHSVVPQGLAEPDLNPRYPQNYAEVMAGERALSPRQGQVPHGLEEVRVGPWTALEVLWLKPSP